LNGIITLKKDISIYEPKKNNFFSTATRVIFIFIPPDENIFFILEKTNKLEYPLCIEEETSVTD
jgi:hypothetical protein